MQSTPPALMHRAFGRFLDDAVNIPLEMTTCPFVLSLIETMSRSFRNTQTKVATSSSTLRSSGAFYEGPHRRRHEMSRASKFRRLFLGYLRSLFPSSNLDRTLEPAQPADEVILS